MSQYPKWGDPAPVVSTSSPLIIAVLPQSTQLLTIGPLPSLYLGAAPDVGGVEPLVPQAANSAGLGFCRLRKYHVPSTLRNCTATTVASSPLN